MIRIMAGDSTQSGSESMHGTRYWDIQLVNSRSFDDVTIKLLITNLYKE